MQTLICNRRTNPSIVLVSRHYTQEMADLQGDCTVYVQEIVRSDCMVCVCVGGASLPLLRYGGSGIPSPIQSDCEEGDVCVGGVHVGGPHHTRGLAVSEPPRVSGLLLLAGSPASSSSSQARRTPLPRSVLPSHPDLPLYPQGNEPRRPGRPPGPLRTPNTP